jgi:hypothetical protein
MLPLAVEATAMRDDVHIRRRAAARVDPDSSPTTVTPVLLVLQIELQLYLSLMAPHLPRCRHRKQAGGRALVGALEDAERKKQWRRWLSYAIGARPRLPANARRL